ncbi:MAG: hypothetical protein PSV18_00525 [Methylobacter sp.]|uniref:Type II secretion system protein GspC N-terminal domain-containing protein n=1 Tax=Candidatus Methylobacter titanis TaxID=3053457 RepID=A0AA43Q3G9_9GAMM|nr:hypothetical protein [Candidatus Methylobacter titanis]MDI1291215.1 hypothetical protein [Candidatus Methylobacter titanis]
MNTKLIKLLVSTCISLCLIIVGEWLYASYMRHRLLTSISSEKRQDYKTDELPAIELKKLSEDSYVDLVARPLFIKGRKPVDEPSSEAEQAAAKSESFDWELTGVYGTQKNVSGLFSRSKAKVAKDNFRKITVGDEVDGWKLTEINKDRAMLKQGDKEKELLLRKPKLKALPQRINGAIPATPAPAPSPFSTPPVAPEPAENTNESSPENQE